jgi:phosphoribosyl 1,2-cyclic phosphodiesterase
LREMLPALPLEKRDSPDGLGPAFHRGRNPRPMSVQFAILASGSRGNAALLRDGPHGLLIDLGLRPRMLGHRLGGVGSAWGDVSAALLTHTHGDHVSDAALAGLVRFRIPLLCHEGHLPALARFETFPRLDALGLIRPYDDRPFLTAQGFQVEPIPLSHDGGPTFGFRVEVRPPRRGQPVALGYVADTGCWWEQTADALTDVDLLAVEFNHDVELQRRSGRHPRLIARNLGDRGHLSNQQGARLVSAVLKRSRPGAIRHLVLLHLSQQCNHPDLATTEARGALRALGARLEIHAACQDIASPALLVAPRKRRLPPALARRDPAPCFPWEAA